MIPRLSKGKPYYVQWDDTLIRSDWTENDTNNFLEELPTVEFMGWYAGRSKDALVFIMHRDTPPGKVVGERIKVQKGMIKSILKVDIVSNTQKNVKIKNPF